MLCEINPNRGCLLDAWLLSVDVRRRQHFGAPPRTVAVLPVAAVGQTELTSARNPKSVSFDINRAAAILLDPSVRRSERAKTLYLLQVAIHTCLPESSTGKSTATLLVLMRSKTARQARALVLVRLLETFEKAWMDKYKKKADILLLAQRPEYRMLHNQFSQIKGWEVIRHTPAVREFQVQLERAVFEATQTAKLIAFSLRFVPDKQRSRHRGGISTACELAPLAKEYPEGKPFKLGRAISTLKTYWPRHKQVAAFLYLARFEKHKLLQMPKLFSPRFASQLLGLVDDRATIVDCFAKYNLICLRLQARGYQNKLLDLGEQVTLPELTFEPLPQCLL